MVGRGAFSAGGASAVAGSAKITLMCAAGPFQPKAASSGLVKVTRTMRGVTCATRLTVAGYRGLRGFAGTSDATEFMTFVMIVAISWRRGRLARRYATPAQGGARPRAAP